MKTITILGATGSIGQQTLSVLATQREAYRVFALTAKSNISQLLPLCLAHRPQYVVLTEEHAAQEMRAQIKAHALPTEVLSGPQALIDVAIHPDVDYVMAAIVGAVGLPPTLAAAQHKKRILLANKEALVMSGQLFMDAVKNANAELLPVDSEHNALFQCLTPSLSAATKSVKKLWLTASGGPFLARDFASLDHVTPDEACRHPNWAMGRKISVDCATMVNKALEIIEARWLFDIPADNVDVVIHPQSVVHSLVEYLDGSILGLLAHPDMRIPIAYALAWPERIVSGAPNLDLLTQGGSLSFSPPDLTRFPVLSLVRDVLATGGTAPAIFNAANEVAVAAFLEKRLRFTDIVHTIGETLSSLPASTAMDLPNILAADHEARRVTSQLLKTRQEAYV